MVGAHGDDDSGDHSGSAYVFVRSDSSWSEEAKLLASDGAAGDWFGWSVGIEADSIVVGAYGDDDSGDESGSAYVLAGFCNDNAACDDSDACTFDECDAGACANTPRLYGDVNGNGFPNVFDIFCILDLIAGDPVGPECHSVNADIAGLQGECGPTGFLNVFDIFAVLDAIAGVDPCCSPQLTGACCTLGLCTDGVTHADCHYAGGVYMGDGTDCGSVTCP